MQKVELKVVLIGEKVTSE